MTKTVKLETASARAILIIAGLGCLTLSIVFAKWCIANAIAPKASTTEVAESAVSLAPSDPQTHYALAVLEEKNFVPDALVKSLAEFEQTTALSPYDFRSWFALGRARERRGDAAGAESAMRQALEFAPNYAQIQWTLGNILLRRGKVDEGFAEIRQAAERDPNYRMPAITTAWQIFDGNLADVRRGIGDSANLNSSLALFLASQKRFDEAIEIWNALSSEDRKGAFKIIGEELFGQLIGAKKYRDALKIQNGASDNSEAGNFALGKIFNGGFEAEVSPEKANVFDWQIAGGTQPQIGFDDAQKNSGNRSLVIVYNSSDGKDFRQISQIVAVEAAKKYSFNSFYKADLKTAATLRWEIADAADGKVLAATDAVANTGNWTNLKTEFTTAAATQAVTIRLVRETCKSIICPITGKIWFDDFSLN